MKELIIQVFNNKEFVLINKYEYKNETVYYFRTMQDELFCTKEGKIYKPVIDNYKLWLFRNIFGSLKLYKNKIYYKHSLRSITLSDLTRPITSTLGFLLGSKKLDAEKEEMFKEEQKENFKELRERFGITVSEKTTDEILNGIKYYENTNNMGPAGAYQPISNSITINSNQLEDDDFVPFKKTRLHETIHAHTGRKRVLKELLINRGFLEGQTESLASEFFGEDTASSKVERNGLTMDEISYNFPYTTGYKSCVSITRQMEVALGHKSHDSIVNGDGSFEKEFAQKYGISTLIYLAGITDIMSLDDVLQLGMPQAGMLKSAQNKLLKRVFNKDFENVNSVEDAREYFDKLREFEKVRARISTKDSNNKETIKTDTTYEEYYKSQMQKVKEKLETLGIPMNQVEVALADYQYERQPFMDIYSSMSRPVIDFANVIARTTEHGQEPNIAEYRLMKIKDKDGKVFFETTRANTGYEIHKMLDITKNKITSMMAVDEDFSKKRQKLEESGNDITDITDTINHQELMKNIDKIRSHLDMETDMEKGAESEEEKALIPQKPQNIFQRILNKIKDVLPHRKPQTQVSQQLNRNTSSENERTYHSWEMEGYSEEEQKRAKNIENPMFIKSVLEKTGEEKVEDSREEK